MKTKKDFAKEMQKKIEMNKQIIAFYENVFLPILCLNFHGKLYNARLINRLNEEAKKISPLMFVQRDYSLGYLSICMRYTQYNYNHYMQLPTKIYITSEGRIDYDKSIKIEIANKWLESFKNNVEEYKMAILHYDEYMQLAEQLETALNAYNAMPQEFRNNMETTCMHIF